MTDLFEGGDQTPEEPKSYFAELVGEGRKFKDQEDLAKGKWHSDHYVKTLEMQKDELRNDYLKLRQDYEARAKLEELVDQIRQPKPETSSNTPSANVDKPGLDLNELDKLMSNKLREFEESKKQQENFNIVQKTLKDRFGSNYQNALEQQIEELGITKEFANNLARTNPNVFYKTFGLDTPVQRDTFQAPPRNTRASDNFTQKGNSKRTWQYYQDLKAKNPKIYYDPKIAVQMEKDIQELGPAFMDGDFKAYGDGFN